jgi:D-arabinose 1-dehydrogenase-like Zn-dependent alcohol dehydrogenase
VTECARPDDRRPGRQAREVLVHAGSGGVFTVAIQLAKHLGATPATTTGTADVDLGRILGADMKPDGHQLGRITELTDSGGSARSSTGSTRSKRRTPPLPTSRRVAPRARSSCP